jgi:hypothetical protein
MKTQYALLVVMLMLVAMAGAWATPSTLIWIPSTDIQANNTWHLGIDNYVAGNHTTAQAPVYDIGPEYGFADGKAEAGIDYITGFTQPLFFNLKYQFTPEKASIPAIAVGGEYFGTQGGVSDYDMLFVEGSKTFSGARLTLGYCHGNKTALGVDPDMLLAGIDGTLTKDKKWWGAVDYQSGQNAFGALNTGVSYNFAANTSVIVGYDWYNNSATKNTFTTQLDINF